ncbi:MAG TPA: PAS domain S-box protein [Verrucomicrobiae bacterium]|jgi:PAS domain S-box-containing protein|nr:PAS domain S-box protein [Verrucomicrobiae bacterium]
MSTDIRHILVVDDNLSIHEDFRKIFHGIAPCDDALDAASAKLFGTGPGDGEPRYELEFASQGEQGLEMVRAAIARNRPYAMAFIDVQMPPGWDGIETMSRIWEVAPDLPIVICTAYSTYSLRDIVQKVGHSDGFVVLKKPFDSIEVLQLANTFSEKWHLLNEINERARKLEESQHRYRFLAEATPGLVWTATANGNRDYLNQRWCDYTGLTVEQSKDWGWQVALHPDDLPRCLDRWLAALRTGDNYEVEYRLKRGSDGVYRWHLCRGTAMRNQHGDIIHWVGTCTDIDDKKRAQEDLEKRVAERTAELTRSEARYRELVNGQGEGVVYTDVELKFTFANPAAESLLGLWPGQLVGRTFLEFLDEKNKVITEQQLKRRAAGEKSTYEIEVVTAQGERRQILITGAPQVDSAGDFCGTFAIFRDITQRKNAEFALRESQRLLRAILDNIPDPAWLKDSQGRYLVGNKPLARIYQRKLEDIVGKTVFEVFPAQAANLTEGDNQAASSGKPARAEICIPDGNGGNRWFDTIETPILNEHGQLVSTVGIARDITERKRDEEHLREREEAFRALADNVPDAVARLDRNLCFAYGNRALANDIKLDPSEFLGKNFAELKLPHHEQWRKQVLRVFETGVAHGFEFTLPGPEGICHRESRLIPERSATGEVEFVLALTRDVTDRKKGELERQLMDVQLRQAQKMEAIGQLAAGIAHEINTPTQYVGDNTRFLKDAFQEIAAALHGYGELIAAAKQNTITPELIARAEEIVRAADLEYHFEQIPAAINETLEGVERVSKIVRAMKEFSHPGGREKSAVDLNRAIESTVTVARNEWKYVADVVFDLDPCLPFTPCFISEFNQAVLNLVVNAAHAIGDAIRAQPNTKGKITIRTRREGDYAEVRISDTGMGIPEVHRHRIFEPFFTTKEVGKGTGQGLTVVYSNIVKKHGGMVTFETEIGKGTTFIMRLPLVSRPAEATPPAVETHAAAAPALAAA